MTIVQEYRKQIIGEYLAPCLKQHAYRKQKYLFYKKQSDCIKLISIQNHGLMPEATEFTINLGVYFPKLAEMLNQPVIEGVPHRAELGHLHSRIGGVIPNRHGDKWWMLLPDSDWKSIAQDVSTDVEKYALAWLDSIDTISTAKKHSIAKGLFILAAAFALCESNIDEAKQHMKMAEDQPIHPIWSSWAKSKGLIE